MIYLDMISILLPMTEKALSTKDPIFWCGEVYVTQGISVEMETDEAFKEFCFSSMMRHLSCDYGDLEEEDIETNNYELEHGGRVLSKYEYRPAEKSFNNLVIYIITESDNGLPISNLDCKKHTTIMFCDEY